MADIDELNTVGSLVPSTTINLSVPSKLNLSKLYLLALVLPESFSVQFSETTVLDASELALCAAAVVLFAALVTPVNVVDVFPV